MKNRISNLISRAAREELAQCGAASGASNRARTMPSKRDKQRDPRRQRRDWRQHKGD